MTNKDKALVIFIIVLTIIAGVYIFWLRRFSTEDIKSFTTKNNTPIVSQATIKWSTYKNDQYKFEIQYPVKGYAIDEKNVESAGFNSIVSVYHVPQPIEFGASLSVSIKTATSTTDLKKFVKDLYGTNFISSELVEINGINWLKVRTIDGYFEKELMANYFTQQEDYLYRVSFSLPGSSNDNNLDKIFSSFKFLSEPTKSISNYEYLFVSPSNSRASNIVGYFAGGAFGWYVPGWLVLNWSLTNSNDGGMSFAPKIDDHADDFSDIVFAVSTSTEIYNANSLYQSERNSGTIMNEVLLNKHFQGTLLMNIDTNTLIYHIIDVEGVYMRDRYYIDGKGKTLVVSFKAKPEIFKQVTDKIRDMVEGIGELKRSQG